MNFQQIFTMIFFGLLSNNCTAMDFNEGMIKIRSFEQFCAFYNAIKDEGGWAIVAYNVNRFSRFYSKGCPALDVDDQKIVVNKKSYFSRVHYALITSAQEGGVTVEEILDPRTWYHFVPIRVVGYQRDPHEQTMDIVSQKDAQRTRFGHNFVFNEKAYLDEAEFGYPAACDVPRETINVLKTKDALEMRALNGADARLLLKLLETQKISLGWQDQGLVIGLKKIFKQENGFSYDSRNAVMQKT